VADEARLKQIIEAGLISDINSSQNRKATDYSLAEVTIGDISRTFEMRVSLHTPVYRDMYFKNDEGRLLGIYASNYDYVEEGDIIAEIIFDQESLEADRERLLLEIEQYEQQFAAENEQRLFGMDSYRNEFTADMSETDLEKRMLRIERMGLEYRQFLSRDALRREDLYKRLAEIEEKLEGEKLRAPFSGIVANILSVNVGTVMRNWQRIFSIIDFDSVQFVAQGGPIDTVRYGDVFEAYNSYYDITVEMRVVSDPIATNTRETTYNYILMPVDEEAFWDKIRELEITFQDLNARSFYGRPTAFEIKNVVVVPRSAIQPEDTKQFVYVYDESGTLKKRYVTTGLEYDMRIQILAGLEPGQMVVIN